METWHPQGQSCWVAPARRHPWYELPMPARPYREPAPVEPDPAPQQPSEAARLGSLRSVHAPPPSGGVVPCLVTVFARSSTEGPRVSGDSSVTGWINALFPYLEHRGIPRKDDW